MRTTIVELPPLTGERSGWWATAAHRHPTPDPAWSEALTGTTQELPAIPAEAELVPLDGLTMPVEQLGELVPALIAEALAAELAETADDGPEPQEHPSETEGAGQ